MPYSEKFVYSVISSKDELDNEYGTVYVVDSSCTELFDDEYSVYEYGQFATCVPGTLE